jgi:hypothetical protein
MDSRIALHHTDGWPSPWTLQGCISPRPCCALVVPAYTFDIDSYAPTLQSPVAPPCPYADTIQYPYSTLDDIQPLLLSCYRAHDMFRQLCWSPSARAWLMVCTGGTGILSLRILLLQAPRDDRCSTLAVADIAYRVSSITWSGVRLAGSLGRLLAAMGGSCHPPSPTIPQRRPSLPTNGTVPHPVHAASVAGAHTTCGWTSLWEMSRALPKPFSHAPLIREDRLLFTGDSGGFCVSSVSQSSTVIVDQSHHKTIGQTHIDR